MNAKNISPKAQHEKQAKAIMARRAKKMNNETEALLEIDEPKEVVTPVVEANEYEGLGKKDLRALCDAQGREYKKKDTLDELIAILEAE